jgi:AcrR family transcriptional regulator
VFHDMLILYKIYLVNFREIWCIMNGMARSYQLKRRGERQDQTRQRIIEAAIDLHQSKGITVTTMSEIAERAKVGRVTVYRHFPDETALVGACSGQYFQLHPLPDPQRWRSVENATDRLRRGLLETYSYHRETEAMMDQVYAAARDYPVMKPYHDHWHRAADILVEAWSLTGYARKQLHAAISLALNFNTWRTLVRVHNLNDDQIVEFMLRLTCDCSPNK